MLTRRACPGQERCIRTEDSPVHLIVNPHSGYGRRAAAVGRAAGRAPRGGMDVVEYTTRAPVDATRLAPARSPRTPRPSSSGAATARSTRSPTAWPAPTCPSSPAPPEPRTSWPRNCASRPIPAVIVEHPAARPHRPTATSGGINGRNFLLIIGVGLRRRSRPPPGGRPHRAHLAPELLLADLADVLGARFSANADRRRRAGDLRRLRPGVRGQHFAVRGGAANLPRRASTTTGCWTWWSSTADEQTP